MVAAAGGGAKYEVISRGGKIRCSRRAPARHARGDQLRHSTRDFFTTIARKAGKAVAEYSGRGTGGINCSRKGMQNVER